MVKSPDSSADFKELRKGIAISWLSFYKVICFIKGDYTTNFHLVGLVKELRAADKELKELRKAVETVIFKIRCMLS